MKGRVVVWRGQCQGKGEYGGEGKYGWMPKALPSEVRAWQRGEEVRVTMRLRETASFYVWELDQDNQENQEIGE